MCSRDLTQLRCVRRILLPLFLLLTAVSPLAAGRKADKRDKKATAKQEDNKKEEKLPLKPVRKVEFTTDEGTWLSLDVSPDGKTIIFDLLGDLYTLPVTGGEAKKITSGMGFGNQPHFSPDGRRTGFIPRGFSHASMWRSGSHHLR